MALLCVIVVTSFFACMIVEWHEIKALPQIGIFYYVWYNPNDPVSWEEPKIVDKPVLGFYDSSNLTVISQHILSMKGLGIDFLIISWWGLQNAYLVGHNHPKRDITEQGGDRIMSEMIAYCGLNCNECKALKATQAKDIEWKK